MNDPTPSEVIELGQNIRRLRKARDMNQGDLAKKANTQITTISLLENGQNKNPGWDLLQRLADALETTVHELALPHSSEVHTQRVARALPDGLKALIEHQDDHLGPSENRISLSESNWLRQVPEPECWEFTAADFLILLRQFRFLVSTKI
ncbi:MAG TPA: helix-turn-helix transcriptional regulator [bacterium]|nr:helix-turn-helix transcriptional regulator [bacterium]